MTEPKQFLKIFILFLLASCNRKNAVKFLPQFISPEIVPAIGRIVSDSSVESPTKILAGKPQIISAGKPVIISNLTNNHIATRPKRRAVHFSLLLNDENPLKAPIVHTAITYSIIAGVPEIVVAKNASYNDNDPENFSSFKSLQGLPQPLIRCMMQDDDGNIWFGTYSGGISKYDGKYFTNYTIAQGLSNDGVWSIIQDEEGNIWMGTLGGGVIKYDGTSFTTYKTSEGLCDNNIYCLYEDDKKNIWIGTKKGLSCYNGKTFTNYFTDQGLPGDLIHSIIQDKQGNIWLGTNKGAVLFSDDSFKTFSADQDLYSKPVNAIFADENLIWFCTDDGLTKYDGISLETYGENEGLVSKNISSLCKDKRKNLWIASLSGGIDKFDGNQFTHYSTHDGLSNNKVTSVLVDRSGTLWIGTNGGGACRYDGNLFTHVTTIQGLAYNEVKGIAQDKNKSLWFATWGGGVSKYDGNKFENFSSAQGLKSNNLYSILADSKGNLWFGADNGVSKYDGKVFTNYDTTQGFSNSQTWNIAEDNQHNLWFATFGDGVYKFDGNYFTHFSVKQGLSNPVVMCLLQDKFGNLWFGTYGNGIFKYDGKTLTNFNHTGGLSSDEVMDMIEDKEGNLWVGTIGGGVNKYDGKTFTHYSTAQGLSNEIVMGILQDRNGNMWFSTRNGLNRMMRSGSYLDSKQNSLKPLFKSYLFEDGFIGVNAYVNSLYQDSKNDIWIGTGDRLTCCHPDGEIADTIPPTIKMMNVSLFNEKVNWQDLQMKKDTTLILANGVEVRNFKFDNVLKWYNVPEHLTLAHNNNYLVFNYIGISTKNPYHIKYQYKLEGVDENWNALTERTEAPYGNIPYGKYIFRVKAMNSEGYWSNEYVYPFEVRPAFWQTWWFYTLCGLVAALMIYTIYRYRLQQVIKLQTIRNNIASDLHDDIGSTLNSISIFSEVAKQQSKEDLPALEEIGLSSRKIIDSMSDIVWTINPENDSFEKIILRMRSFAYQLLRAKEIEMVFRADRSLNSILLPMLVRKNFFLIFKEATNNMVKYSGTSRASFHISYSKKQIILEMQDNGKGFSLNEVTEGNGIKNMRRRANEIKAELNIVSNVNEGTCIKLIMTV